MPALKYKKKTYAGATFPVLEMTKAEYDALPSSKQNDGTVYLITDDDGGWEAERSTYDNTESGLTATNVQAALDEIVPSVVRPLVKAEKLTVFLANSQQISKIAGEAYGIRIQDGLIVCFMSLGFKPSSVRAGGLAVFKLQVDGQDIVPVEPYFLPCSYSTESRMRFSYRSEASTGFFTNPVAWEANVDLRISGVFIGSIQS